MVTKQTLKALLVTTVIVSSGMGVRILKKPAREKITQNLVKELDEKVKQPLLVKFPVLAEPSKKEGQEQGGNNSYIVKGLKEVKQEKSIPVVSQAANKKIDHLVRVKDKKREWLTTQFKANHFDLSDRLYPHDSKVTTQFEPLDHKKLFSFYKKAMETLQQEEVTIHAPMIAAVDKSSQEPQESQELMVYDYKNNGLEDSQEDRVVQVAAQAKPIVVTEPSGGGRNPFLPERNNDKIPLDKAGSSPRVVVAASASSKASSPDKEGALGKIMDKIQEVKRVEKRKKKMNSLAETTIRPQIFSFNKGPSGVYRDYEITSDYSDQERWSDQGSGLVSIQEEINSSMGIMGTSFRGRDVAEVRFDLVLEQGIERGVSIPAFFRDELQAFLNEKGFSGEGGLIFIELDESTDRVILDAEHKGVIYLDQNLKPVGKMEDYLYLFFVGVTPGSTTIEYTRNGYENLKKVILITEGVIYYDLNEYVTIGKDIVEINERKILGEAQSNLNIQGSDIVQFNTYESVEQIGPGRYDLSVNVLPLGTRKYMELNHLSSPIYLGRWDADNIVVPSEEYIGKIIEGLGFEDLSGMCLIQVNFDKPIADINIEGSNGQEYIPINKAYIDGEGTFTEEVTTLTKKGFFVSDQTGVVSIRISYEDGKKDFFNSYCADSLYIIEQL